MRVKIDIPAILVGRSDITREQGYVLVTIRGFSKRDRDTSSVLVTSKGGLRAYISSRRKLSRDSFTSLPLGNLRVLFREVVSFLLVLVFARTNRNFGARYLRIRVMHPKYRHIR